MHFDRKLNRAHGAHKLYKERAARGLEFAAAVLLDLGFEQLTANRLKLSKCSGLIYAHATAIAHYIGGQGRRTPSWHRLFSHQDHSLPDTRYRRNSMRAWGRVLRVWVVGFRHQRAYMIDIPNVRFGR